MPFVAVAKIGELVPGKGKLVHVNGEEVGLFLADGEYYAIQNTCPHREAYLHEGDVHGTQLTCPWHFAIFDLKTGQVLEGPAEECLRTYKVVVEDETIKIEHEE